MTGRLMPTALRDEPCCVSDTFSHLYGIPTPANLMERFDEVDIEAIAPDSLSNKNQATHFSMKGPRRT